MEKVINNPFMGRTDGLVFPSKDYKEDDFAIVKVGKKTNQLSDDPHDFDVVDVVEITDVVKREDYINQFADDVGILNILKKVAKTGDTSLLKQAEPGFGVDLTNMPDNWVDAAALKEKAMASYNKLPEALRKDMSVEDFMALSMDAVGEKIDAYIAGLNDKGGNDNA